ncbi:MAG: NAD(P)H-dependent oxidoreductase [Crocinitomicaceae bacterium]|nr:NAD(P)H-dependent oxidoreductase [Crocinitomicaceae bacterium]
MKYTIICGSQRKESQSLKVSNYIKGQIESTDNKSSVTILDLGANPIPFWNEGFWEKTDYWTAIWEPISKVLTESSALIIVSPEYGGMVPGVLKNFFLFPSINEVGHKPALIVSVSAGMGGSYPVSELRCSSAKNNKICYIPDHLIIRNVNSILNGEGQEANDSHDFYIKRIDFSLNALAMYAKAMNPLRENNYLFQPDFKNGM